MSSESPPPNKMAEYSLSQEPCPRCGCIPMMDNTIINLDWGKGIVFTKTQKVSLYPLEADLLKILLDAWPEAVTRSSLLLGLYGSNYENKIGKGEAFISYLSRLRTKVKPLGLNISNDRELGWWISRRI